MTSATFDAAAAHRHFATTGFNRVWELLEKPNLAPEEARDYAALRRWAHRFYPGEEPSPIDFGYTATGEPDPAAAGA